MRLTAVCIFMVIFCGIASADVIHFKDGGEVEGVIADETEDRIVIDIGFGTMTVRPEQIDFIEESSAGELERLKREMLNYEIGKGEWAPDGYEDLRIVYCRAKDDRASLEQARKKQGAIGAEIQRQEREVSAILELLDVKGIRLNRIDPEDDVQRYNEMATEINSLNVDMDRVNRKVNSLYDEEKELNAKVAKLVSNYLTSFELFMGSLEAKRSNLYEESLASDELQFLEEMDVKLKAMAKDFKEDIASYTRDGEHVIVNASINGRARARLMVDTGASIVIITSSVARRLGIDYENMYNEMDIVMADGSLAKARPIILDSVKVGDAEVEKVQAAIIESDDIGGVEGLLGMSFLSQFIIKFNSIENELILERVL